jgi:fibronectin-binding autotransporter adhesin
MAVVHVASLRSVRARRGVGRSKAKRWLSAAVVAGLVGSSVPAGAADQYWDLNGTTAGAGGAAPVGSWTGANWNDAADGTSTTATWVSGNNAFFSAGNDATGTFTVNAVNAQTVANIRAEEGTVTLGTAGSFTLTQSATWGADAGASLAVNLPVALGGNTLTFDTVGNTSVSGVISGTGSIDKTGTGTLTLSGASTFTGATINITGGVLAAAVTQLNNADAASPLGGAGARAITIDGGTFRQLGTTNVNPTAAGGKSFVIGGSGGTIDIADPNGIIQLDDAGQFVVNGPFVKAGTGRLLIGNGTTAFSVNSTVQVAAGSIRLNGSGTNALGNASGVSVDAGAELDVNGLTAARPLTLAGTGLAANARGALTNSSGTAGTYTGTIAIPVAASLGAAGSGGLTVSGVISGAGVLTKGDAGTVTLSGANNYSGGTVVAGGTLLTANAAALGTGVPTVTGGVLAVNSGTTLTTPVASPITLNGGILASNGTTNATITNGVVAGTGAHTIAPGNVGTVGTLTIGTLTSSANTTLSLDFNIQSGTNDLLVVSGASGFNVGAGTVVAFNVAPTAAGTYKLIGFNGTGTAPALANFAFPAAPNGRTTYTYTTGVDANFIDLVVASGQVISTNWQGAGAGPLSWTTPANWTNGVPGLAGDTANFLASAGATAQTVTLDGQQHVGTLTFNNPSAPAAGGYTLTAGTGAGSGLFLDNGTGAATLTVAAGSHAIAAPLTLVSNSTVTVANAADALTVSGAMGAAGFGTLTKNGNGTLVLSGANAFPGATTINAGTVRLGSGTALGTAAGGTTVAAGATLNVNGQSTADALTVGGTGAAGAGGALVNTGAAATVSGAVTLTGNSTIVSAGSGLLTANGTVALGANTLTIDGAADTTIGGAITGTGGLVKQGAGKLTLGNTGGTFTGPIAVNAGTLSLSAAGQAGTGGKVVTVSNGATLATTTANYDPGAGTVGFATGTGGGTFDVAGGTTFTLNDAGQFGGTGNLTKAGTGLLVLGQTGTPPTYAFTGAFNVAAGSVQVLNTAAIGTPTALSVTTGATIDLRGIVATAAVPVTLNGTGISSGGALTNSTAGLTTQVGAVTLASNASVGGAGDIVFTGATGGAGSLTKIGAGSLTLSGAGGYAGGTTVSAGTLVLNNATGSATGSGNVTVNAGTLATTAAGAVGATLLGGSAAHVIAPGGVGSVGTLTVGGLTANAFTTLSFDLAGPGATTGGDLIIVTGANALAGTGSTITFSSKPTAAGTYRLFDYNEAGAAPAVATTNFAIPAAPNGRTSYALSTTADPGYVALVVSVTGANTTAAWVPGATGRAWDVPANWDTGVVPTIAGDTASFTTSSDTSETIPLNVEHHVSALTFNNPGAGAYTLSAGTAGVLAFDNGNAPVPVSNARNNNVVSAPVSLTSNTNLTVASGTTLTLSGAVSGPRPLTLTPESAGGTLVLSGTSTFTGGLVINGGTVNFATDANLGGGTSGVTLNGGTLNFTPIAGTVTLAAGRVITVGPNGGTLNLVGNGTAGKIAFNANQLAGSGTITKTGQGDVQILGTGAAGVSSFSGTFIANGLIEVTAPGSFGTGSVVVNLGGELAINNLVALPNATTLNDGAVLSPIGGAGGGLGGPTTINGGVNIALRAFNATGTANGMTLSGPITGAGNIGFVASTSGTNNRATFLLSGNNANWSGSLTTEGTNSVNGVTIRLGSPTALGNSTGSTTIVNGGLLDLNGITLTNAEPLTLAGTGPNTFPTTLTNELASTPATFSGPVTLQSDTTIGSNNGGTFTLSGAIGGGGRLTKIGTAQTTVFSGPNTYSGGTTLTSGTLSVGSNANLGAVAGDLMFNGGNLQVTGTTMTSFGARPVTFVASRAVGIDIAAAGNRFSLPTNAPLTLGQTLTKIGPGTLVLTAASNTVTQLNLTGGTLDIGATDLTVNNGGGNQIIANGTADTAINGTGSITMGGTAGGFGDNDAATGTTLTINPRLTAAAGVGFEYFGGTGLNGTIVLANPANDFTGVRLNSAGTVSVARLGAAADTAGPLGRGSGLIEFNAVGARLVYTGPGETTDRAFNLANNGILEQAGTGPLKLTANVTATGANTKTLTLQGSTTGTGEISGTIVNNSAANTTAVVKAGTGTWTLSAANTYSGGTIVSAGTLLVNNGTTGSGTGTGPVTVNGGTLGGSGSIVGAVAVNATATLSPGNSPGVLSITSSLALNAGSTYLAEVGGAAAPGVGGYDQTQVTGLTSTLTLAGGLVLAPVGGYSPTAADVYYVLTQAGTTPVNGAFAGAPEGAVASLGNGVFGRVTYLANWTGDQLTSSLTGGNDVAVYAVSVPEPATAGMAAVAAAGLLARRRRRR